MKRLLISVCMACVSCFSSFAVDGIIGIRADKSQESFVLSDVSSIKIASGTDVTLSVNQKNGKSVDGFKTIVFNADLSDVENNMAAPQIQMYPNPVENIIYVSGLEKDADIKVLSIDGKTVKNVVGQQIEVSDLAKGMYLLSVEGRMIKFMKK